MTAYIHNVETVVPPHAYPQHDLKARLSELQTSARTRRIMRNIYDRSGIRTRYSVLPDFKHGARPELYRSCEAREHTEPTTGMRNDHFAKWIGPLCVEAARRVFESVRAFTAESVTHVITVSCTGFCNPGPDIAIVRALGLSDSVERYHIGFMGCYAAFPALRMAQQFCQARPEAVVLVVCAELCTLHMHMDDTPDNLLANALFADGVAAALISARPPEPGSSALAMHGFSSALAPEGEEDMAWTIGDRGFDMRLSTYVPDIIARNVTPIVDRFMEHSPWNRADIGTWAVHPGGRAILDSLEEQLQLHPDQLEDARSVLSDYGNMSSATVLFVLKRILEDTGDRDERPIFGMAFGPGLTIESALMTRFTTHTPPAAAHQKEEDVHVSV